jgi:hypothetical protein
MTARFLTTVQNFGETEKVFMTMREGNLLRT